MQPTFSGSDVILNCFGCVVSAFYAQKASNRGFAFHGILRVKVIQMPQLHAARRQNFLGCCVDNQSTFWKGNHLCYTAANFESKKELQKCQQLSNHTRSS